MHTGNRATAQIPISSSRRPGWRAKISPVTAWGNSSHQCISGSVVGIASGAVDHAPKRAEGVSRRDALGCIPDAPGMIRPCVRGWRASFAARNAGGLGRVRVRGAPQLPGVELFGKARAPARAVISQKARSSQPAEATRAATLRARQRIRAPRPERHATLRAFPRQPQPARAPCAEPRCTAPPPRRRARRCRSSTGSCTPTGTPCTRSRARPTASGSAGRPLLEAFARTPRSNRTRSWPRLSATASQER